MHETTKDHWDVLVDPLKDCLSGLGELLREIDEWYTKLADVSLTEKLMKKLRYSTKLGKLTSRLDYQYRIFSYIATTSLNITATQSKKIAEAGLEEIRGAAVGVRSVNETLELRKIYEDRQKLIKWLSPSDPSTNHHEAQKKREPKTGSWFVDGPDYATWLEDPGSFLWLHGIPGCGKTVLCSTIIAETKRYCDADVSCALAYFYFDFNDAQKQKAKSLLRSLVIQLSSYGTNPHEELFHLYTQSRNGERQPTSEELSKTLLAILRRFSHVYIIIDALDECAERDQLFEMIEEMVGWKINNLHILCTSREERDIKDCLSPIVSKSINIQSHLVDEDIRTHIHEIIRTDKKLRSWPAELKEEVEDTLSEGAQGMFRWAACQLDVIRKCLTPLAVKKGLKSLPKTLHETYDRILTSIDEEYREYAFRALQWITFSAHPLTPEEISDALAIHLGDDPCFQDQDRMLDPQSIRKICGSLITLTDEEIHHWHWRKCDKFIAVVKLAHYSVKEYLISRPPLQIHASLYLPFERRIAEDVICQSCLVYLLQFGTLDFWETRSLAEFPLAVYAAMFWTHHIQREKGVMTEASFHLMMQLLDGSAFANLGRIAHSSMEGGTPIITSPFYYASSEGLLEAISQFLANHESCFDINRKEGSHGTALKAASSNGHEKVVDVLLAHGADVHLQGGSYGTALGIASNHGHEKVVEILLTRGADVNLQGGYYGTVLGAASLGGHEKVVEILLAHGAHVDLQGGHFGTALGAATYGGHEHVVKMLLAHGADVNLQRGDYGTALGAATYGGSENVVEILLAHGTDVNLQGGHFGTALGAASLGGHKKLVEILLAHGADVNLEGGYYGTALGAAAYGGHEKVVETLLAHGANVNLPGGDYGTALSAATYGGYKNVVEILLAHGADVNLHQGNYGTALGIASYKGYDKVVEMLLIHGADINLQGGDHDTALGAASLGGHKELVEILLACGADVNLQGGYYGTALGAASYNGHEKVMEILLAHGADVSLEGGHFGTALGAAALYGDEKVVKMLLAHGANVNVQGGKYGTALGVASNRGHEKVMEILLAHGADVNLQGGHFGTALGAASWGGHEKLVAILLAHGADVNLQGGEYGTALGAASYKGHENVVETLLSHGADVNLPAGDYGTVLEAASYEGHDAIVQMLLARSAIDNILSQ